MKRTNIILGSLFIIVGGIFLTSSLVSSLSLGVLWPLFLLIPIVSLLAPVSSQKDLTGVIFWVVYLAYLMVFFLVLNTTGWERMETLWPHFLLAAACGFFAEFLLSLDAGKLWPMGIVGGIGIYFLFPRFPLHLVAGVLLILWGIWILFTSLFPKKTPKS